MKLRRVIDCTMNVSVIVTVKNEGDSIRPLLDSLIDQTRQPDEVVITDGGSTDNTREIIEEYEKWLPLKLIDAAGANISEGRNIAIKEATGLIIAATDAGVVLGPYWIEALIKPIQECEAEVVSGWFEPDPYTDFEVVMGATVLPTLDDIEPTTFLPSSRSVAFLKETWEKAGGYPEWLDYSEDLIFDLKLKDVSGAFAFTPEAVAYFRPRGSLQSYYKQYYNYARGDGKANLWPRRHAIRYVTYLLGLPIIGRLIYRGKKPGWLLLLLGISAHSFRPMQRLAPLTEGWRPPSRIRAFALVPVIRLVGDVAKMLGYPVGLYWRYKNQDKIE